MITLVVVVVNWWRIEVCVCVCVGGGGDSRRYVHWVWLNLAKLAGPLIIALH